MSDALKDGLAEALGYIQANEALLARAEAAEARCAEMEDSRQRIYHILRRADHAETFIPLTDWCVTEIEALPKTAVQLFVSPSTQRPYKYDHMTKEVRRIARAAGLPDELQVRAFRYEAAQQARDGGAGRGDVQSLLAHKSPGTQDFYAEGRDATGAQAARKLWKDK